MNVFTSGLVAALTPLVSKADDNLTSLVQSQQLLTSQLDRLSAALQVFESGNVNGSANENVVGNGIRSGVLSLGAYSEKLVAARKRLAKLNSAVLKINQRLEDIRTLVRRKQLGSLAYRNPQESTYSTPHSDPSLLPLSSPLSSSLSSSLSSPSSVPSLAELLEWDD